MREVDDVVASREVGLERGSREIDDEATALLLEARLHTRVGGAHDHASRAVLATPEIDLADRRAGSGSDGFATGRGRGFDCRRCGCGRSGTAAHVDDDHVAFDARRIDLQTVQVEHETRATARLGCDDRIDAACLDVDAA